MAKLGVSLRIDNEKIEAIDELAKLQKRDRTFIINDAIESYLELNRWQIDHIKSSLTKANQGKFASAKSVEKVLKKWR